MNVRSHALLAVCYILLRRCRQSESIDTAAKVTASIAVRETDILQHSEQVLLSNAEADVPQVLLSVPPLHLADGATIVGERVVTICDSSSSSDGCSSSDSVSSDHAGEKHVPYRSLLHQ